MRQLSSSAVMCLAAIAVGAGTWLSAVGWLLLPVCLCLIAALLLLFKSPSVLARTNVSRDNAFYWLIIAGLIVISLLRGYAWLQTQLEHRLPGSQNRTKAELTLLITDVEQRGKSYRIFARVLAAPESVQFLRQVRLNWYGIKKNQMEAKEYIGSRVKAQVLLRSPRSFANGLAFDYEAYLLTKGIDATGYIRSLEIESLRQETALLSLRSRWRQYQTEHLSQEADSWVGGLVFADGQSFTPEQWQLAKATGTIHLLVVSGLHIGIMVLVAMLVSGWLRRLYAGWIGHTLPGVFLYEWALVLLISAAYLYIAGGGVSLQRSWLMLFVFWLAWWLRIRIPLLLSLATAAWLVLMICPLMYTQIGFVLSFSAVSALLLFFSGRRSSKAESFWLPHIVIFVMMAAPLMLFQGQVQPSHIFANMVSVPLVTLVILPLSFLTALSGLEFLQSWLVQAGDLLWLWLSWIESLHWPIMYSPPVLWWMVWGALLVLWMRGLSWLYAGMTLLLPVLLFVPVHSPPEVRMLDVGQGLSVLFTDHNKSLIYDTGARFSANFDMGSAVILPVLRQKAIQHSLLVVSYADNDHAGGAKSLLAHHPVYERYSGQPALMPFVQHPGQDPVTWKDCHANHQWQRVTEQMTFRFFPVEASLRSNDNNASCVMQVMWYGYVFLLTGDIEKAVERHLLQRYGTALESDVLVVPHHGSRTSSSADFIQQVLATELWISSGFNNHFHHPHPGVLQRLSASGAQIRITATEGAIRMSADGEVQGQRSMESHPWRQH